MSTYLPPIQKPRGLVLKMVYVVTRRQFGKVATPLAVFSARVPLAFLSFYGKVSRLDKKLKLPAQTAVLLRERVASLNTCRFCLDVARWYAQKESADTLARVDALAEYHTSPLFTDAERAALDYATELTTAKEVTPDTFARLARHYSEREICDIVWLVASEHLYNMTNMGLNIGSDGLCELRPPRARQALPSSRPDCRYRASGGTGLRRWARQRGVPAAWTGRPGDRRRPAQYVAGQ